jgi:hypothetical protein
MIEDISIRNFAPKTQHDYVQRIKEFTAFLGRSPDTANTGPTDKLGAAVSAGEFLRPIDPAQPRLHPTPSGVSSSYGLIQ